MHVTLTPGFARAVDEHLAAHPPERMLHALGRVRPDGSLLLSHWVPDLDADASGVHVQASAAGQAAVQAAERDHGVTYLGVVHSHPIGVPDPSGQDGNAVADLLALNPHLPVALVGVVIASTTARSHALDVCRGELVIGTMTRGIRQLTPATVEVAGDAPDFWAAATDRLPTGALDALHRAHATVVGAGSLGSTAAEQLVRAGIPRITLIDPDRVEGHNLTRTTYQLADVGRYKVDALADRLRSINPHVQVDSHTWPVDPSAHAKLADIVADSTIVLGLADAPRALALLDEVLHEQGAPGPVEGFDHGGLFAGVPGQHALQTLWARATGDPDCDRCAHHRGDHLNPVGVDDPLHAAATEPPPTPPGPDDLTPTPAGTGVPETEAVPSLAGIARLTLDWARHHTTNALAAHAHALPRSATRRLRQDWTRSAEALDERRVGAPWHARASRSTTRGDSHDGS